MVLVLLSVLAACSRPSPTPTAAATLEPSAGLPLSELAPSPPPDVQALFRRAGLAFEPLNAADRARVRITAAQAKQAALASRWEGYDSGNGVKTVIWTKVGCIYLGMYTALAQPHAAQPRPQPAYLVQTLAEVNDAGAYLPKGLWIGVSAVDAIDGALGDGSSSNVTPDGVMGSTCGVTL